MVIKFTFGERMSKRDNWEVYSYDKPVVIEKKYWQTHECALAYAKILNTMFVNNEFKVRWCKPYPVKPVKNIDKKVDFGQ
jgi:hypothetical protein